MRCGFTEVGSYFFTFSFIFYILKKNKFALENVVVFGLQFLIHEIAAVRITKANVEEAEKVFNATFPSQVFNKKGWMAIVKLFLIYCDVTKYCTHLD